MHFSIIIPAYNCESFIEKCLFSACEQNYPSDKFEVIVIDDKSSDSTCEVVKRCQQKYKNLSLYQQEVNQRQGAARNVGIRNAKGKYICFLDADDYWKYDNVLKEAYEALSKSNADIWLSQDVVTQDFIPDLSFEINPKKEWLYLLYSPEVWLLKGRMIGSAVLGAYKKSLIIDNNLYFRENVSFEDSDWNCKVLSKSNKIAVTDVIFYAYITNPSSTIHTYNFKLLTDEINSDRIILEYFNQSDKLSEQFKKDWANKQLKYLYLGYLRKTKNNSFKINYQYLVNFRVNN